MNLKKGEIIIGEVVEVISSTHLICSFSGTLMRVSNYSGRRFKVSNRIPLLVKNVDPLELQVRQSGNEQQHKDWFI